MAADVLSKLDDAKAEVLARAAEVGERRRAARDGEPPVGAFLQAYYRHVAAEDVVGRDPVDVYGAAMSHKQLAARRPQGTAVVRVFTPSVEEHGWSSGHTVVEVVTDDMPFLVDSVTAELTRRGRALHLVIHPQLAVCRDVTGAMHRLLPDDTHDDESVAESWMHIEIDRETEEGDLADLASALQHVLRDVREAVEDWPKMRDRALRLAQELGEAPPVGLPADEVAEGQELLTWLADDHFTFLGYREYRLGGPDGDDADALLAVPGSGLGILRNDQVQRPGAGRLPADALALARQKQLLVLTKANSRSTVHRPVYLDYVGVKAFDESGEVVGERRFLGLFSSAAYTESAQRIPVLRRKVAQVLERSGLTATSHSGKDLVQIIETYPRDELFQVPVEELQPVVMSVLHLKERRQLRLYLRKDDFGRFMSCLVYLPRDRYTTDVRLRLEELLRDAFDADSVDYTARVSESVLARLHFVVRMQPGQVVPAVDAGELEERLAAATRSWADDFADALVAQAGEEDAARLLHDWPEAFPEAYKEDFPARTGVADLRRVDALRADGALSMSLYTPYDARPGERRFKIYRCGRMSLSEVLPVLQRLGVDVMDERPYELIGVGGRRAWVYDFGLRYEQASDVAPEAVKELFQDAFRAVWNGDSESDGFNALVLRGGLTWRQATLLRAYAKYLRQGGSTFSQDYIEQALLSNVGIARLLVRLFEARMHPAYDEGRQDVVDAILEEIVGGLDAVASLDQDRILRSFLTMIRATLRTSYFQDWDEGRPKPYLALKLDPQRIPELPQPRPKYEIFVYSPRFEGVHLRFGPVARGGLRWSDRREDFRTEVLGLVKAQMVKNAVIVPVGAKGGFVLKRPPAATGDAAADRDALLAEGIACYRLFIAALLDITDNLAQGEIVPPRQVVRHDGDDAYLVVAADKGTATFSDIANEVAIGYGFWLGDAFASGGSVGYDHKAMGITARGAWESVRRHFRELGVDVQSEDFTVVGVGDMSGDVFGNGMLLSEHIRLVAAFDHRHIFFDPSPDAATSFAERRRLFELPRSSWADYDRAAISAGGGVHPRSAKSIPISAEVRQALGIADESVTSLAPPDVLRAILQAPVDLLWNGGIGTYVKASTESHADAGDKANDAIRVDGQMLRCKVVGEGGNLGMTQLGRIEYALAGGRVNTDAIDNSAGVDTSDHEVNIKILLDRVVQDGDLTAKQRNELLVVMTDEVGSLVLRDNYEQNVLLGNARVQAHSMLPVHKRFIKLLEKSGELNRGLEFLPRDSVMDQRFSAGLGLTSPEFAVLVAYSKITLKKALLASSLPDEPWFTRALRGYFPREIAERYGDRLHEHPLRREVVTTRVVNDLVNRGGITFVFRATEESGADPAEIARAYTVVREVFGFAAYWRDIESIDGKVPTQAQTALYLEGRRLLDRSVRWLLQTRRSHIDVEGEIERFREHVSGLSTSVAKLLRGAECERLYSRAAEFEALGAPADLALRASGLLDAFSLLEVVDIAEATGRSPHDVAPVYFALSERFEVDRLLTRITALPRDDRWQALARSALRYDLYAALASLTRAVLAASSSSDPVDTAIASWEQQNAEGLARTRATLEDINTSEASDLAALSVALRAIRTLVRG